MKLNNKNILFSIVSMLFVCSWAWSQNGKAFTVILDAGHGGKDPASLQHDGDAVRHHVVQIAQGFT